MKLRVTRDGLATFGSSAQVFETHNEHDHLLSHPGTQALDVRIHHLKF